MTDGVRIAVTLALFAGVLVLVVVRPRRWPEAMWTSLGAAAMLALGLVGPRDALAAVLAGKAALLFLLSLLALALLVGKSGFFDWAAIHCARLSRGHAGVLYRNVFILGALVTATLSLDTTAVMLTPVVLVVVKRLDLPHAPFVVLCAVVANVGSLLLPISNLTNLLFADAFQISFASFAFHMLAPQLAALAVAFIALRWRYRNELGASRSLDKLPSPASAITSPRYFRWCSITLAVVVAGYFVAPIIGIEPYVIAFAGVAALAIAGACTRRVHFGALRELSWGVFPLVAGLFIMVRAVENLGVLPLATHGLAALHGWLRPAALATATALTSNVANNLPAALLARSALADSHTTATILAPLIGADVGSMMTPLGSLATLLVLAIAQTSQ